MRREVIPSTGWPYTFRARIESRVLRLRGLRFRYVGERKWVHWDDDHRGRWRKTEAEAEADANRWLDGIEGSPVKHVEESP
jgi:hypothetical protein